MKKITSLQYDWNFLTLVECKIVTLKHFGESRLRGFTIEYLWYSDHYHWQQSKICAVTTISNNCTKLLRWLPWPPCRSQLPFVVVKIAVVVLFSFVLATATVVVRVAIDYLALLLVDLRSVIPATTNSGYYFIIDKRDVCKTYAYGLLCVCVNHDLIETASTFYIDSLLDITILTIISLLIAYLKETNIN